MSHFHLDPLDETTYLQLSKGKQPSEVLHDHSLLGDPKMTKLAQSCQDPFDQQGSHSVLSRVTWPTNSAPSIDIASNTY